MGTELQSSAAFIKEKYFVMSRHPSIVCADRTETQQDLRDETSWISQRLTIYGKVLAAVREPSLWQEAMSRLREGQSVDCIAQWADERMLVIVSDSVLIG